MEMFSSTFVIGLVCDITMGTLVAQSQMGDLENGLKDLKRSRLMAVQEFKDMYWAIDKHHRDLKLAHLSGKSKDILVQVQQDARFFHILIQMMSEVKQLKAAQQRESLQQVYTWFKLNRHTLHSGPRFGKVHHKKEAQDILKTCTTPRSTSSSPRRTKGTRSAWTDSNKMKENKAPTVRLTSAGSSAKRFFTSDSPASKMTGMDSFTPRNPFTMDVQSSKDYVNEYLFSNFLHDDKQDVGRTENFVMEDFVSPYEMDVPEPELQRLASSLGEVDVRGVTSPPYTSPRDDGSNVSARYIDSLVNESRADINDDDEDLDIDLTTKADCDDNEFTEMRRKLSRPQTESPSLRGAISNQASSISVAMPKKMIHPIASLVNPHAQLAAMEAQKAEEEYLSAREKASSSARGSFVHPGSSPLSHYKPLTRPSTVMGSRADNLHAWKNFSRDMSYGQDILSKLNFVGRSGTAMDVRYTAHENADIPEDNTAKVVTFYTHKSDSNTEPPLAVLTPADVQKENILLQQPLEEFYQMTDGYYPHKIPKYKSVQKPKSAPPKRTSEPLEKHKKLDNKTQQKAPPLGKHLIRIKQVVGSQAEERIKEVKLDAVYSMIDTVTDEMSAFKEKLAPSPQPGFRQPSSSGVSMRPLSRPTTATGHRSPSPIQRANTPTRGSPEPEYFPHPDASLIRSSNASVAPPTTTTKDKAPQAEPLTTTNRPLSGREILIPSPEDLTSRSSPSHPADNTNNAVDWRGKVTPESSRYKWQKTRFGGHTYIKKLQMSKRPVGATHAGKRPRTAPLPTRERWNTENPSDLNTRAPSQAATHNTKMVDQKAVDNMLVIQHLIGSGDSRVGSMQSLFLDEEFLKSFSSRCTPAGGSTITATPASVEYLSFVSNAPKSVIDSRAQSRQTRRSDRTESRADEYQQDELTEESRSIQPTPAGLDTVPPIGSPLQQTEADHISCHIPANVPGSKSTDSDKVDITDTETVQTVHTDAENKECIDEPKAKLTEDNDEVEGYVGHTPRVIDVIQEEESEVDSTREQTPSNLDRPILYSETHPYLPDTSKQPYYSSEDLNNGDVHIEVTAIPSAGRAPTPATERAGPAQELSQSDLWHYTPIDNPDVDTEEITELAEDKPKNPYLYHRGEHWTKAIVKPENYCFTCLPDSMSTKVGRSAGRMPGQSQSASSQVLRMARKQNEYFSRAPPIRTPPSIPSPYHQSFGRSPRYGETYNSELERHARKVKSPRHFMEHVGDLRKEIKSAPAGSFVDSNDLVSSSLLVSRLDLPSRSNTEAEISLSNRDQLQYSFLRDDTLYSDTIAEEKRPSSGKKVGFSDGLVTNGDINSDNNGHSDTDQITKQNSFIQKSSDSNGNQDSSGAITQKQKSIAYIGRPIAQVSVIHDPEEEAAATRLQKQAKAAVDIQRIFRGYVARCNYKKLLSSERQRLEDERTAELEKQRQHKAHVERTQAIYNRKPVSQEQKEWANNYKEIKEENAKKRDRKMEELAEQNHLNHQQASSKIAVIGPHVEIYQVYHPKQTGPTRKELEDAAVRIQKHMRGFVVRRKFQKLKRKAQWHGSSFKKMVRDYKGMLSRCQTRHGVNKPSTPFTFEDMNEYMDSRRRYESVFDRKAFGGELEKVDLEQFFRECDLYPSSTEIEESLDVVLHGSSSIKRGLQKKEILECVYYIYVPKATGLTNTRQSTWLNPIIDGVEARKLLGSDSVEPAPLEVCAKLVIDSKRERREKEREETYKLQKEQQKRKSERKSKRNNNLDNMSDTSSNAGDT